MENKEIDEIIKKANNINIMSDTIKNRLGITIIIGILAVSYAAVSFVKSYSDAIIPSSFRSFSVSAEGKAVSIPDIAAFSFGVITEGGNDIGTIQKENTTKMNGAISYLKSKGISEKDVKTENYLIEPRYEHASCLQTSRKCPPPEIIGYKISQNVSVKIRDFSKIGDLLSGIVKNGTNSVSSLNFTLDDPTSVEAKARAQALKKARTKAEEIAKAGGFKLGKVLGINEGGYYPTTQIFAKESVMGIGGDTSASPLIQPGSEDVKVNVIVTYEIR